MTRRSSLPTPTLDLLLADEKRQVQLVADALESMRALYSPEDVSVLPMVDALQLLLQRPVVVAFVYEDRIAYSSLADPELVAACGSAPGLLDRTDSTRIAVGDEGLELAMWGLRVGKPLQISRNSVELYELEPSDASRLRALGEVLSPGVRDFIRDGLTNWSPTSRQEDNIPHQVLLQDVAVVSAGLRERAQETVRSILDEAIRDFWSSRLVGRRGNSTIDVPNFFFVVRSFEDEPRRGGSFAYSARILLTHTQVERVREWSLQRGDSEFVASLESPLGLDGRSIADSVFSSGVVDFSATRGGDGRDDPGNDLAAGRRAACEAELYEALVETQNFRVFYVPIHVSGSPWLAAYSLLDADTDDDGWRHAYQLQRTLIPQIAARIRQATRRAYLRFVAEIVSASLTSDGLDVLNFATLNEELESLTRLFPFPQVSCAPNRAPRRDLRDPLPCSVALIPNRLFESHVRFGQDLTRDEVLRQIQETRGALTMRANYAYGQLGRGVEFELHTWRNASPSQQLRQIEADLEVGRFEDLVVRVKDARKSAEVLDRALDNVASELGRRHPMDQASLRQLLGWLSDHRRSFDPIVKLEINSNSDGWRVPDGMAGAAVRLLWNLWSNCTKAYTAATRSRCAVDVRRNDVVPSLSIRFSNQGVMPVEWRRYLNEGGVPPSSDGTVKGLMTVRRDAERLGWMIQAESDELAGSTVVNVQIPTLESP